MENIFKLKHFEQFVNEAVRTKDEAKAFDLIASYLSRKMGETLYPYPFFEKYTKKDGTSGFGKRYYADSGKSIRVNVDQSEGATDITSIDYWDGSSSEPSWTVDGFGQSLAKVLPQVADQLVNPEAQLVAPDKVNEAKKVTDDAIKKIVELSNSKNAKEIASEVGFTGAFEFDTNKPDGTFRKLMDTTKINNLGWKPSTTLEEGIRKTILDVWDDFNIS